MNKSISALLSFAILSFGCRGEADPPTRTGCRDVTAMNYDPRVSADCNNCCTYLPPTHGTVMFYILGLDWCVPTTITLNTGQRTIISNSVYTPPLACQDREGYFYLPVGTYTFTLSCAGSSTSKTGTLTIIAQTCTKYRL